MGACAGPMLAAVCGGEGHPKGDPEEQAIHRRIDKAILKEKEKQEEVHKLLLLGAGESGKSTLFKQMLLIYGNGFSRKQVESFRPVIYSTTITAMKILVEHTESFYKKYRDERYRVDGKNQIYAEMIKEVKFMDQLTPKLATAVEALWNDPAIKEGGWEQRHLTQIPDTSDYFFSRARELASPDYVPSEDDVLRVRARTTGVVETLFNISDNQFVMLDVGGQRSERKKWIHCFENVSCVLFVAAISGYNQLLFEDGKTNRLSEALVLFDDICNSPWFVKSSMVLFLNKSDLFKQKIRKFPITVCPDLQGFDGDVNSFRQTAKFIEEEFMIRNRSPMKTVYPHVTCATNRKNVAVVFNGVKDTILKKSLEQAGLVLTDY